METGFFDEIFLVKLLSIPQQKPAKIIPIAPMENLHWPVKFQERSMLAKVINKIDIQTLLPMYSLKNNPAINAVATPSKFKSKDAVEAGVIRKLNINKMGAITPPDNMAPTSQRISFFEREASSCSRFAMRRSNLWKIHKPAPLPIYKNAASGIGSISLKRSFERGALTPNSTADSIAII